MQFCIFTLQEQYTSNMTSKYSMAVFYFYPSSCNVIGCFSLVFLGSFSM